MIWTCMQANRQNMTSKKPLFTDCTQHRLVVSWKRVGHKAWTLYFEIQMIQKKLSCTFRNDNLEWKKYICTAFEQNTSVKECHSKFLSGYRGSILKESHLKKQSEGMDANQTYAWGEKNSRKNPFKIYLVHLKDFCDMRNRFTAC